MNRILLTGMLCIATVSMVDASPRERRARRRVSRRPAATARPATTQSYYNYRPAQATYSQPNYSSQVNYGQQTYTQPAATPSYAAPQRVTTYKPVISDSVATSAPIAMADSNVVESSTAASNSNVTPISTVTETGGGVAQASALQPVPDVLPTLKSNESLSSSEPFCASCTVIPAGQSFNSALAELNGLRAQKGLPALVEDPSLSAIAHKKASIQANAGAMYHPGGSMGSARYEGVGMGPRFTSCYQDATNVRYAGAATVVGRNGQRYHCLLVK